MEKRKLYNVVLRIGESDKYGRVKSYDENSGYVDLADIKDFKVEVYGLLELLLEPFIKNLLSDEPDSENTIVENKIKIIERLLDYLFK